jgi:hypothetical protein
MTERSSSLLLSFHFCRAKSAKWPSFIFRNNGFAAGGTKYNFFSRGGGGGGSASRSRVLG